MDSEIIYKETYTRIIDKESLKNFIIEEEEIYNSNFGWTVGPIIVETIDNERIRITTELTKRKKDENIYKKTFVKTIKKEEYNQFISSMYEQYPEDLGWTIGEPLINELNSEEIIVRLPLTNKQKSKNL